MYDWGLNLYLRCIPFPSKKAFSDKNCNISFNNTNNTTNILWSNLISKTYSSEIILNTVLSMKNINQVEIEIKNLNNEIPMFHSITDIENNQNYKKKLLTHKIN